MARLRQRGGIGAGIAGAAGNINAMLQDQWSQQAIQKRQGQLAQLQHMQELEKMRMEHPDPAIMEQIIKNPETTSPELVRQSLMNASKNGAPNVPRQQNDQSQWGIKSETTAPAEGQISSRQISQTTPLTQMIDTSLNTLKGQQTALAGKQARENNENPVYSESIGPNGETIKQSAPRGTPTTSTGATDQQAAARAGAIGTAQHAANRATPEDIAAKASEAAAVASAENPALEARAAAGAAAQEAATAPRRAHEEAVTGAKDTKQAQLAALDKEEASIMPQVTEMLKDAKTAEDVQRVTTWATQRRTAVDQKRNAVITGKPIMGTPAPNLGAAPAKANKKYNPVTQKLE